MRQLYASPHQNNIDRLVALLGEHGIACSVQNVSRWNKRAYQRFSYQHQRENRDAWPQVWVTHADDYTRARELLREMGLDPAVRHSAELAAMRNPTPLARQRDVASRVRRIVLLGVVGAFIMVMLRYLHIL